MFAHKNKPPRFAVTVIHDDEVATTNHKAFDLADLDELRRQGKPISTPNAESMYYDGSIDCTFNIPLSEMRGVDINDMWNDAQERGKRLSKLKMSTVQSKT